MVCGLNEPADAERGRRVGVDDTGLGCGDAVLACRHGADAHVDWVSRAPFVGVKLRVDDQG